MSITIPATGRTGASRRTTPIAIAEDSMTSEVETLLPPGGATRSRWLDLGFRLIILALAAVWLLTPPTGGAHPATDGKTIATAQ